MPSHDDSLRAYLLLRAVSRLELAAGDSAAPKEYVACEALVERLTAEVGLPPGVTRTRAVTFLNRLANANCLTFGRCLGAGGQGVAFIVRATDEKEGVLKVLDPRLTGDPQHAATQIARIVAALEALTASAYDHCAKPTKPLALDGVGPWCEFPALDGQIYGVLSEFGGHQSICDHAANLALDARVEVLLKVARTIEAGHAERVVHLDLTPSNVKVDAGRPRVIDFGSSIWAAIDPPKGRSKKPMGTPGYGAPEQFGHVDWADQRLADVFALGALLFEILAGRPLWSRPDRTFIPETAWYSADVIRRGINTVRSSALGVYEEVVCTAIAFEPNQRYASAEAMVGASQALHRASASFSPTGATKLLTTNECQAAFDDLTRTASGYIARDLNHRNLLDSAAYESFSPGYFPLRLGKPKAHGDGKPPKRSPVHEYSELGRKESGESEPVAVEALLAPGARFVLRGGAGSGKTTLFAHLARLARKADCTPIVLSAAQWFAEKRTAAEFLVRALVSERKETASVSIDETQLAHWIERRIRDGCAAILLDGWDELGEHADEGRRRLADFLELEGVNRCSVTVSSRPDRAVLEVFDRNIVEIQPLRLEEEHNDVAYFVRLFLPEGDDARHLLDDLAQRDELTDLRHVPFFVSLVAWLAQHNDASEEDRLELPFRLEEVYELAVRRMLLDARKHCPDLDAKRWRKLVEDIAWASIDALGRETAKRAEMEGFISRALGDQSPPPLDKVRNALSKSRLVVGRGAWSQWLHPTMQEFLAACYLARGAPPDPQERSGSVQIELHDEPNDDRRLHYVDLADTVLDRRVWENTYELMVQFYGRIVSGTRRPQVLSKLAVVDRIDPELQPGVDARKRIAVANVIGNVCRANEGKPDLDPRLTEDRRWILIPAQPFWYGGENRAAREDEYATPFELHRWPVTVAEYAEFVAKWPTVDRRRLLEALKWPAEIPDKWWWRRPWGRLLDELRSAGFAAEPESDRWITWSTQQHLRWNHPVVNVNWFQAWAYCAWRTMRDGVERGFVVLPTDDQWERAARFRAGSAKRPATDEVDYPWDDVWNPERANVLESGVGRTTAVGVYPTVDGQPWDLAGNVREWCQNTAIEQWSTVSLNRDGDLCVLRGGGFRHVAIVARCSCRFAMRPEEYYVDCGFRPARVATGSITTSPPD